jgi:hypothetical protein
MVPDRIRMPLLGYFALVAPLLVAMLYVAEATMGPPGAMKYASEAPVLVKREPSRALAGLPILTVRDSMQVPASAIAAASPLEPDPARTGGITVRSMQADATATPARPSSRPARNPSRPKQTRTVREVQPERDRYAFEPRQRPFFGIW